MRVAYYFPYDLGPPPAACGLVAETLQTSLGGVHVLRPRAAAPTVAFLHGVSLDCSSWTPLLRAAGSVEQPWLLVDVPGFGRSDPLPGPTSLDDLCGALVDVFDGLADGPVHVVGHSMGGFIGLHLAATRADHRSHWWHDLRGPLSGDVAGLPGDPDRGRARRAGAVDRRSHRP